MNKSTDYMGTPEDAKATFMAKLDAWIELRQPIIATAAELRKRETQEREALFQLGNAAALYGWFIREGRA